MARALTKALNPATTASYQEVAEEMGLEYDDLFRCVEFLNSATTIWHVPTQSLYVANPQGPPPVYGREPPVSHPGSKYWSTQDMEVRKGRPLPPNPDQDPVRPRIGRPPGKGNKQPARWMQDRSLRESEFQIIAPRAHVIPIAQPPTTGTVAAPTAAATAAASAATGPSVTSNQPSQPEKTRKLPRNIIELRVASAPSQEQLAQYIALAQGHHPPPPSGQPHYPTGAPNQTSQSPSHAANQQPPPVFFDQSFLFPDQQHLFPPPNQPQPVAPNQPQHFSPNQPQSFAPHPSQSPAPNQPQYFSPNQPQSFAQHPSQSPAPNQPQYNQHHSFVQNPPQSPAPNHPQASGYYQSQSPTPNQPQYNQHQSFLSNHPQSFATNQPQYFAPNEYAPPRPSNQPGPSSPNKRPFSSIAGPQATPTIQPSSSSVTVAATTQPEVAVHVESAAPTQQQYPPIAPPVVETERLPSIRELLALPPPAILLDKPHPRRQLPPQPPPPTLDPGRYYQSLEYSTPRQLPEPIPGRWDISTQPPPPKRHKSVHSASSVDLQVAGPSLEYERGHSQSQSYQVSPHVEQALTEYQGNQTGSTPVPQMPTSQQSHVRQVSGTPVPQAPSSQHGHVPQTREHYPQASSAWDSTVLPQRPHHVPSPHPAEPYDRSRERRYYLSLEERDRLEETTAARFQLQFQPESQFGDPQPDPQGFSHQYRQTTPSPRASTPMIFQAYDPTRSSLDTASSMAVQQHAQAQYAPPAQTEEDPQLQYLRFAAQEAASKLQPEPHHGQPEDAQRSQPQVYPQQSNLPYPASPYPHPHGPQGVQQVVPDPSQGERTMSRPMVESTPRLVAIAPNANQPLPTPQIPDQVLTAPKKPTPANQFMTREMYERQYGPVHIKDWAMHRGLVRIREDPAPQPAPERVYYRPVQVFQIFQPEGCHDTTVYIPTLPQLLDRGHMFEDRRKLWIQNVFPHTAVPFKDCMPPETFLLNVRDSVMYHVYHTGQFWYELFYTEEDAILPPEKVNNGYLLRQVYPRRVSCKNFDHLRLCYSLDRETWEFVDLGDDEPTEELLEALGYQEFSGVGRKLRDLRKYGPFKPDPKSGALTAYRNMPPPPKAPPKTKPRPRPPSTGPGKGRKKGEKLRRAPPPDAKPGEYPEEEYVAPWKAKARASRARTAARKAAALAKQSGGAAETQASSVSNNPPREGLLSLVALKFAQSQAASQARGKTPIQTPRSTAPPQTPSKSPSQTRSKTPLQTPGNSPSQARGKAPLQTGSTAPKQPSQPKQSAPKVNKGKGKQVQRASLPPAQPTRPAQQQVDTQHREAQEFEAARQESMASFRAAQQSQMNAASGASSSGTRPSRLLPPAPSAPAFHGNIMLQDRGQEEAPIFIPSPSSSEYTTDSQDVEEGRAESASATVAASVTAPASTSVPTSSSVPASVPITTSAPDSGQQQEDHDVDTNVLWSVDLYHPQPHMQKDFSILFEGYINPTFRKKPSSVPSPIPSDARGSETSENGSRQNSHMDSERSASTNSMSYIRFSGSDDESDPFPRHCSRDSSVCTDMALSPAPARRPQQNGDLRNDHIVRFFAAQEERTYTPTEWDNRRPYTVADYDSLHPSSLPPPKEQ